MNRLRLHTLAPHLGDEEDDTGVSRPLVAPIYQTSAFSFDDLETADQVQSGTKAGYIYSRMGNPTIARLEQALAQCEGAEDALVTASGMAAITASMLSLVRPGERILAGHELYGGTTGLLKLMGDFGIMVDYVDTSQMESVSSSLNEKTRLVLAETITNPRVAVADVARLASCAHAAGAYLMVDNTFATPYHCQPLAQGADLVVHSLTKFIGGHGDLTGGVCLGRSEIMDSIRSNATLLGAAPDPFAAWLTLRGMKTLALRMEKSSANALYLAERLRTHSAVEEVYYPGLTAHPTHDVARRTLNRGFGAMFSLRLKGGTRAAQALVERSRLVRFVPSLGDVATTLSYPLTTSHRGLSAHEQVQLGITGGLIRISTGIEDPRDLWDDLLGALDAED